MPAWSRWRRLLSCSNAFWLARRRKQTHLQSQLWFPPRSLLQHRQHRGPVPKLRRTRTASHAVTIWRSGVMSRPTSWKQSGWCRRPSTPMLAALGHPRLMQAEQMSRRSPFAARLTLRAAPSRSSSTRKQWMASRSSGRSSVRSSRISKKIPLRGRLRHTSAQRPSRTGARWSRAGAGGSLACSGAARPAVVEEAVVVGAKIKMSALVLKSRASVICRSLCVEAEDLGRARRRWIALGCAPSPSARPYVAGCTCGTGARKVLAPQSIGICGLHRCDGSGRLLGLHQPQRQTLCLSGEGRRPCELDVLTR
mmetsp:Transcript_135852/g.378594  ORF Transcript_135852/g.378594 Transcript_135852/m.378594 type:complete len:309 (-) Transcript_135852:114-1040(-)